MAVIARLRLTHLIGLGFVALFMLCAALGIAGIVFTDRAAMSTANLHQQAFTAVQALGDARNRILEIKAVLLMHMAFPKDSRHGDLAAELHRLELIADENLLLANSRRPIAAVDTDSVAQAWNALKDHVARMAALLDEGRIQDAHDEYHHRGGLLFSQALDLISDAVLNATGQAHKVADDTESLRSELRVTVIGLTLAALIAGGLIVAAIAMAVSRPLGRQHDMLRRIAAGDLDAEIPDTQRSDEIGDIARAVDQLRREVAQKAQTQLQFQTIFKTSPDIVTITHQVSGCFLDVNEGFERHLGWSRQETLGRSSFDLNIWIDRDGRNALIRALQNDGRLVNFKTRARRKNGEIFDGLVSAEQFTMDGIPCMILVARDISEIKKHEDLLQRTIAALEAGNMQLERFAQVAAHDLQEPCRAISSFAQLLERSEKNLTDRGKEYLHFLITGALRMRDQIKGLQTYSRLRIDCGPFVAIDMNDVLQQALMRLHGDEAGARITRPKHLPKVMGEAEQLIQLFVHVIGNSLKFQPAGKSANIEISAEPEPETEMVWFTIQDDGIGIDPRFDSGIFDIFRRLHGPEIYPGIGLGLTLAQMIVRRHGGDIALVRSGKPGACIRFSLKAAQN